MVDHIYVINLDRRKDRWDDVKKKMKQHKLEIERFPAVDGNNIDHPKKNPMKISLKWWNKYALGLVRTLRKVIVDARDKGYEKIIIFEDDIILDKNFNKLLKKYMKLLPEKWDIVQLSGGNHRKPLKYVNDNLFRTKNTLGTYAMLIHSRCFEDFIRIAEWELGPADDMLRLLQKRGNCYMFYPGIVTPKAGFSDIMGKNIDYTSFFNYKRDSRIDQLIIHQKLKKLQ